MLETRGAHWLVRTPDGAVGWVHRTTLEAAPVRSIEAPGPHGVAASPDESAGPDGDGLTDAAEPGNDDTTAEPGDFFQFSTGGLGAPNGEPRVH